MMMEAGMKMIVKMMAEMMAEVMAEMMVGMMVFMKTEMVAKDQDEYDEGNDREGNCGDNGRYDGGDLLPRIFHLPP